MSTICVSNSIASIDSLLHVDSEDDHHGQAKGDGCVDQDKGNDFQNLLSVDLCHFISKKSLWMLV